VNMKKKTAKNLLRSFWIWLGKQNVFLVFGVFFLIIYGTTKTYAYFFPELNSNKRDMEKSHSKPIIPTPTPAPTFNNQNFNSNPSATHTPTPTTDQDPIIECSRPDNCGGGTIKVKRSECFSKVCCPVSNDKYETLTSAECFEKRNEYLKKQTEEYLKKRDEEHQKTLDEYKKLSEQYEAELNQKLLEQQSSNDSQQEEYENQIKLQYDICVSNARDKAYTECRARNTCDSYGYGSPSWQIQQETAKCKQIYYY